MSSTTMFSGMPITLMGLGLHGGGLSCAQYLHEHGAVLTITDMRTEKELVPVLAQLPAVKRLVLGKHEAADFRNAAVVVKNPAVKRSHPLLQLSPVVTTDIALFLMECAMQNYTGAMVAVTGSKGKSTTAAAVTHILQHTGIHTCFGGNITVSPLSFVHSITNDTVVVLEISSFQAGDLLWCRQHNTRRQTDSSSNICKQFTPQLRPRVAVLTNILHDHQDYYSSMQEYIADKQEIFAALPHNACLVLPEDCAVYASAVPSSKLRLVSRRSTQQSPLQHNLAIAAQAAEELGIPKERAHAAAAEFRGIPHRMETILHTDNLHVINDSASTIPEATLAAVHTITRSNNNSSLILITGGTDKNLSVEPLMQSITLIQHNKGNVILLHGSATKKLHVLLRKHHTQCPETCRTLQAAVQKALQAAKSYARCVLLFSPGCASFEMFANEFERGNQFRALIHDLA